MRVRPGLCRLEAGHGDPLAALEYATRAIRSYHDSGNTTQLRTALAWLAAYFDRLGHPEPGATIAGFAFDPSNPLTTAWIPELDSAITHLRDVLGDQTYESLARRGEAMATAAIATYAFDQNRSGQNGNRTTSVSAMETLRVGAAFPDPPFNGMAGNGVLDIDLMTAIAKALGATVEFIPYDGADFNGIFDALNSGDYDCVAAGTTVTPGRETKAQFVPPYLISGQSLAVDTTRLPNVRSIDHLAGLTIGVQQGNTSQPIADRLVAEGKAARVHVYDYGSIRTALTDLTTGGCDAFMKLAPVLTELVKPIPGVEVVQRGISVENIAIAVPLADHGMLGRITAAQAELEQHGTLQGIRRKWLGNPYTDQSLAVH